MLPGMVALAHQVLHKAFVSGSISELAAAAYPQGLIDRFFEAKVGLLHIPILMSNAGVVPGGLHAVVAHERLIAGRPVFTGLAVESAHRRGQMIGAMLRGY